MICLHLIHPFSYLCNYLCQLLYYLLFHLSIHTILYLLLLQHYFFLLLCILTYFHLINHLIFEFWCIINYFYYYFHYFWYYAHLYLLNILSQHHLNFISRCHQYLYLCLLLHPHHLCYSLLLFFYYFHFFFLHFFEFSSTIHIRASFLFLLVYSLVSSYVSFLQVIYLFFTYKLFHTSFYLLIILNSFQAFFNLT